MNNLLLKGFALAFISFCMTFASAAQSADNLSFQDKKFNEAQQVASKASLDDNLLILSGKIIDAETKAPLGKTKINLSKFGDELVQASIDNDGKYAIALRKDQLGEPTRITFKVPGYKRYIIKNIDKRQSFVDVNIVLEAEGSREKSSANVVYKMSNDPFNPLVLRFE